MSLLYPGSFLLQFLGGFDLKSTHLPNYTTTWQDNQLKGARESETLAPLVHRCEVGLVSQSASAPAALGIQIQHHRQNEDHTLDHPLIVGRDLQQIKPIGEHAHDECPYQCTAHAPHSAE